jgi:hypothetical protein
VTTLVVCILLACWSDDEIGAAATKALASVPSPCDEFE